MIAKPNIKVNFGLNVLRKRDDGYHDVETLFVPSNEYCDNLEIITGEDYSRTSAGLIWKYGADRMAQGISDDGKLMITIAGKDGIDWDPLQDLCAKAYFLLDSRCGLPPVKIYLEKNSPTGAGLGGGSSDAAFTLKMLDEIAGLGLGDKALASMAAELGSDCPFFIYNRPMFGEGRGEILSDFPLEMNFELKVVVPEGIRVSTAQAYGGIVPRIPEIPLREVLSMPVSRWKDCLVNDFEKTVFPLHPELQAVKDSLYESGAAYASMSGSGSAVFAIY